MSSNETVDGGTNDGGEAKGSRTQKSPLIEGLCAVCLKPASTRCSACRATYYCCREHQTNDWKTHKATCAEHKAHREEQTKIAEELRQEINSKSESKPQEPKKVSLKIPPRSSWARGLQDTPDKMYEWFVDCYRLRLDDDYAWGGGYLHGLYDPDCTSYSVTEDFLIYAKLSALREVVPVLGWDWAHCLKVAVTLIPFAFEKSDAKEKYDEHIANAAFGGRSLRLTAELIYGTSISEQDCTFANAVMDHFESKGKPFKNHKAFFDNVGGVAIWKDFKARLMLHNA